MYNKKGLSTIVATVLIVLLALAAIAVVWSFFSPTITGGSAAAQNAANCQLIQVRPVTCVQNTTGNTSSVNVELTSDPSSKLNLVGAILINADGTTTPQTGSVKPNIGGTDTVPFTGLTKVPVKARAYATIIDAVDSTRTYSCPANTVEITCVPA